MKNKVTLLPIVATALFFAGCSQNKTIKPQRKSITEAVYASGFVAARNEYKVFALADGSITAKFHEAGDTVKAGDPLFRIQSDAQAARSAASDLAFRQARANLSENSPALVDLQLKISNAQTQANNDEANFNRYKNMYEANAISKAEFDRITTVYEISKNNVRSAKEAYARLKDQLNVEAKNAYAQQAASSQDLSNYLLKSLLNGMVYETYKQNGESVRRNDAIALVGEMNGKYLQLSVDQQDIDKIRQGQEVIVKMDISGDKLIKAKVSRIYPGMNQNDQSFRVDAEFLDSISVNYIHASVEANIIINKKDNALVVPRNAVRNGDEVMIKASPSNKTIKVKKGLQNLEEVEILEGISANDEVILPKD